MATTEPWAGIVHATGEKLIKGAIDATIRGRFVFTDMQNRGRINTGVDGSYASRMAVDWKEAPVEGFGYGDEATYAPQDYLKNATVDWRGYKAPDMMHEFEYDTVGNTQAALVRRYNRIMPKLIDGVRKMMAEHFYIDGDASGNEKFFHGMESFCGYRSGEVLVGDIIAPPDDTYFGLDTDEDQGGTSWSTDISAGTDQPNHYMATDWPEGTGSTQYDFWSPLLVNWASTSWPSGQNGWLDNGVSVLRRVHMWLTNRSGMGGGSVLCVLAGNLMSILKDSLWAKVDINAPHVRGLELGHPDTINFEGLMLRSEYGIPANTGYVVDMNRVQLDICRHKQLIRQMGPYYDEDTLSWKWIVLNVGNYKFFPRNCAKLYPYAAS